MYKEPEMEIVRFESTDILTASGGHVLPEDDE